jgi:hypothetical protein
VAKLTKDGKPLSSGKGMPGLHASWLFWRIWVERQLPQQTARARAAATRRKDASSSGGD